jgi:hypothetical protein
MSLALRVRERPIGRRDGFAESQPRCAAQVFCIPWSAVSLKEIGRCTEQHATRRLGGVLARYLGQNPALAVEATLSDCYVDLLGEGIDVAIRIGRLLDSDLVARRLGTEISRG